MSIKLNPEAIAYAKKLINAGEVEHGDWDWKNHKATEDEISKYLNTHYMKEYKIWFLGLDTDIPEENKEHYLFPIGDLKIIHKNALVSSAKAAEKAGALEISQAAADLIKIIQNKK